MPLASTLDSLHVPGPIAATARGPAADPRSANLPRQRRRAIAPSLSAALRIVSDSPTKESVPGRSTPPTRPPGNGQSHGIFANQFLRGTRPGGGTYAAPRWRATPGCVPGPPILSTAPACAESVRQPGTHRAGEPDCPGATGDRRRPAVCPYAAPGDWRVPGPPILSPPARTRRGTKLA